MLMKRHLGWGALLLPLVLLDGCGSGSAGRAPHQALFTVQPGTVRAGADFAEPVRVLVLGESGTREVAVSHPVTLTLTSQPGQAELVGTTTVNSVDGVATFRDLRVTRPGEDYRLVATVADAPPAVSDPFTVVP